MDRFSVALGQVLVTCAELCSANATSEPEPDDMSQGGCHTRNRHKARKRWGQMQKRRQLLTYLETMACIHEEETGQLAARLAKMSARCAADERRARHLFAAAHLEAARHREPHRCTTFWSGTRCPSKSLHCPACSNKGGITAVPYERARRELTQDFRSRRASSATARTCDVGCQVATDSVPCRKQPPRNYVRLCTRTGPNSHRKQLPLYQPEVEDDDRNSEGDQAAVPIEDQVPLPAAQQGGTPEMLSVAPIFSSPFEAEPAADERVAPPLPVAAYAPLPRAVPGFRAADLRNTAQLIVVDGTTLSAPTGFTAHPGIGNTQARAEPAANVGLCAQSLTNRQTATRSRGFIESKVHSWFTACDA
eukprot:TRINITY_DN15872_c0_g1_i1.p1 TRINITY_DN15872_c0_g1~~TRINITY_DN15872_c0_g1_i1.p1  ORF type:complete len:371 (+),score=32.82 TRINITY_DN15872_c0_g1_i1:25-1113(+)